MHSVVPTSSSAPPAIATGFVRKLYRILDQNHVRTISWDPSGLSFSIYDEVHLEDYILPQYFRGRLDAFRQQLKDHGFEKSLRKLSDKCIYPIIEGYHHPHFMRGCPEKLNRIIYVPTPRRRHRSRKVKPIGINVLDSTSPRQKPKMTQNPLFTDDLDFTSWLSIYGLSVLDSSPRGVDVFKDCSLGHHCKEIKTDLVSISSDLACSLNKKDKEDLSVDCSVGVGFDGSSPFSDDTINWMMASWGRTSDTT